MSVLAPVHGYFVALTPEQLARADQIAQAKHRRWHKAPDEAGVPRSVEKERLGARGELAVAIALGWEAFWPPASSRYDVAAVQVRSTRADGHGTLILQPWRKGWHPEDPYVLAIAEQDDRFRIAGWCYGSEHLTLGVERDFGYGPCWSVVQTALRPMGSLPGHERALIQDVPA